MKQNYVMEDDDTKIELTCAPEQSYLWLPTGDPSDIAIAVSTKPNIINRIFQRLFFGFRYIEAPNHAKRKS
jgi:hypothetical protein